jgi:phenylacetate-coenzyme A ligase PaaK-like adenylate-forming protein
VERLQKRRLQRLVRHAMAHSPYFREKYRGIDPRRFALEYLPTTNKEELMEHFDEVVADRRIKQSDVEAFAADSANLGRWFLGEYAISHTSGTSGRPSLIVQDRRALRILIAAMSSRANAVGKPGIVEGIRRLRSPVRAAIVSLQRGFYPSGSAFEFMTEIVGRFVRVERFSSMQPDLVEKLNEFQPNALVSYAGILDLLANSEKLHLKSLRQIANSSERLTPLARKRIRHAFGVSILDHYGLGECLMLSEGCPTDGGAHLNADWAILEVVDEQNRPVPDGQLGQKVLVTNLANFVQPCIRYEVGDRVAMAVKPCRCGSRLPRIDRIEGRAADIFWTGDGERPRYVTGPAFQMAADSLSEVREWQAVQRDVKRIEIRLELLPHSALDAAAIDRAYKRQLREAGLAEDVAVEIRIVPLLASDPVTGKFRRMISHVPAPHQSVQR